MDEDIDAMLEAAYQNKGVSTFSTESSLTLCIN